MASQNLQQQFMQALQNSKNFQSLKPNEQDELKLIYVDVSDDQLTLALEEIKMDDEDLAELEADNTALTEQQEKLTQTLKGTMRSIQKEEIEENTANDKEESIKAAEAALHELD